MGRIPENRIVVNDLMAFNAEELAEHAEQLAEEIRAGDYEEDGEYSLRVALGHLVDHVVDIWHLSTISDAEYEQESQQDYEARCLRIPNFQDGYHIVDIDD